MICPQCKTENRDERTECYHCGQELATLRMILNRARNHYNEALEHAERERDEEAIRELKHALELDGSFVEAWLVLGTLHARSERMDEAREAWQTALSQDPRFERGHQYLLKAQQIEPSIPALRKLKISALALGGCLVLAVALLIYISLPDSGMQKIGEALNLREEDRWSASLERLADAKSDPFASRKAKNVAGVLGDELSAHLQTMLESIELKVENRRYPEAVDDIAQLESLEPPGWVQQQLGVQKSRMDEAMLEAADSELAAFRSGEISFEQLEDRLASWAELAAEAGARTQLSAMLDEGTTEYRRTIMAGLRPEILSIEDDAKAAQRVDELAVQYPALREELEALLRSRLAVVAESRSNEFDRLVSEGRLAEAEERMLEFRSLYEGLGRTAPEDVTRRMEEALKKTEKTIAVEQFRKAFQAGDYEQVLRLAPALAEAGLAGEEREEVEARRAEAERLFAGELWDWSQELDQKFETLNISLDQARRMIAHHDLILRHAPPAEATYRVTHTLFRTAAAQLRIGKPHEARALVERLRSEYPKASVLGYSAFSRFEKRLAQALERD